MSRRPSCIDPKPSPTSTAWTGPARAFLELGTGPRCCFPIGDPREDSFRFCCAEATVPYRRDGKRPTYCAEHAAEAWAPAGQRHTGWRAEGAKVAA